MEYLSQVRVKPWQWLIPAVAMLLLLGVACGSAAQPDAPPADTGGSQPSDSAPTSVPQPAMDSGDATINPGKLSILVGGWGGRWMPMFNSGGHAYGINSMGFLVRSDENRQYIPGIATDWSVSEDGLTWTFTVRDDALWHDGTPLTVEDVLFTWEQAFSPASMEVGTSSTQLNLARNTAKLEISGPNQISFTTKDVDSGIVNLFSDATGSAVGALMPASFWDGFDPLDADRAAAYDQNPIGAGPLKAIRIVSDEVMEFERFDQYYDDERSIKVANVDLFKVPDLATRAAALEAGDADIAPISLDTSERVNASGGRIVWGPEASYFRTQLLGAWLPDVPYSKKEVRQAMQYALDMSQFQALYGEEVFVPKGMAYVTPSSIGYSPELDAYEFDPDKARELMTAAGFPNGEGFGKLIINTWQSQGVPFLPESAELAANMWKTELGIDSEVRVGDEVTIKQQANSSNVLDGQIVWRDNETRVDGVSITRSGFAQPENAGRAHEDPAIFAQAQAGISVIPPVEKDEALRELYRTLRDEGYRMSIGYINIPWGVTSRVEAWTPQPMAFYPSALHTVRLAK